MDSVFRTKQEAKPVEEHKIEVKTDTTSIVNSVPLPYTDDNNFLDNYFSVGIQWHDQDAEFYPEIKKIDNYIRSQIANGEIENSSNSVKNLLKSMEKLNNLKKESRSVVRLEVIANYVEFLMKNDNLKSKLRRYAY